MAARLSAPRPGRDEITVVPADSRHLCYSLEHRTLGKLAEVIVVFGDLGTGHGDALWPEVWGTSRAMCKGCWELTRTVVTARRPHLVIHDRQEPGPAASGQAGPR